MCLSRVSQVSFRFVPFAFDRFHLSWLRHHAGAAPDSSRPFRGGLHAQPALLLAIPFLLFALVRYTVIVMRGGVPRPNALPAPVYLRYVLHHRVVLDLS